MRIKSGDCVKLPDGRLGRVRDFHDGEWRVRVKRRGSKNHQFLYFRSNQLKVIDCPKGWMSVKGYDSYVKRTLSKMRKRLHR
ncbi:MAG: hypothetical protein Harvfovirus46_6 [Harvfovirus sp.]|uniref:Uncharacterized protein n=1 Tax=Harvfovirus sp. TaxID=2487768 RepID=A0A3G5A700_9VIRU|nr:MAG: hypothetical protein Harvfovirus46_6 [Harvfovirus sp.]